MSNVGYATLTIIPSMKGFKSALEGQANPLLQSSGRKAGETYGSALSRSATAHISGGLTKALGSAARSVVNLGGAAATAATTGVAAIGTYALAAGASFNVLNQTSFAAFKTILGTSAAADTMVTKLNDFAKSSPFPKQVFIKGAQQLLGFGLQAEKVIPALQAIQDATAAVGGNSEDISQITFALAQIQGQGKLTGQTLNQLGQYGIDAASIIGKQMGKTSQEIRDMASQPGGIPAAKIWDPLIAGLEGRFGGAAANVKKTMVGSIDRIKAALRDIGSDLLTPFIGLKGGGAAVDAANKLADAFRVVQKQVIPALMPEVQSLASRFADIATQAGTFLSRLSGSQVTEFVAKISGLGRTLGGASGIVAVMAGRNIPFLGSALASINPLVAGLVGALLSTSAGRDAVLRLGEALKNGLRPVIPLLRDAAGALASFDWSGLLNRVGSLASQVGAELAPLAPKILEVGRTLGTALVSAVQKLVPPLERLVPVLAAAAAWLGDKLASGVKLLAPAIPVLASFVGKVVELIAKVPPQVIGGIAAAFLAFKGTSAAVGGLTKLADAVGKVTDKIAGIPTDGIEKFGALRDAVSGAAGKIKDLGSGLGGAVTKLAAWSKAAALGALNTARQTLAFIAQKVAALAAAVAAKAMAAAQWLLNAAMDANPIGAVILALTALVGGFVLLYTKVTWFHNLVQTVWNWLKTNWPLLLPIILGPFGIIAAGIITYWGTIRNTIMTAFNFVKTVITTGLAFIQTVWNTVWNAVSVVFSTVWGAIQSVVSVASSAVRGAISLITGAANGLIGVVKSVGGWFKSVFGGLGAVASAAWNAVAGPVNWVIDKVRALIGVLADLYSKLSAIMSLAGKALGSVLPKGDSRDLVGQSSGQKKQGNARGNYLREGFSVVNEEGPELLYKRGNVVNVLTAGRTKRELAGAGQTATLVDAGVQNVFHFHEPIYGVDNFKQAIRDAQRSANNRTMFDQTRKLRKA